MQDRSPARPLPSRSARREVQGLLAGAPHAVLERLTRGDPLGLREVVGARLRSRWLLLDADRVHLRALALVAHEGGAWSGRPGLAAWLAGRVDRAIDEVLREVAAGEGEPGAAFRELAGPLGLTPAAARAACAAFDARGDAQRRAFFRLVLEGMDLDGVAREEGVSASEIGRRARVALEAVLAAARQHGATNEDEA